MATSEAPAPELRERDLILGFTRAGNIGAPGMVALSKIAPPGTTFRQMDLAGPWRVYMQRVESKLAAATWQIGLSSFGLTGAFSGATLRDVAGVTTALTTGSLAVASNGSVTGTLSAGTGAGAHRYEIRGTMRGPKDLITGVVTARLGATSTYQGLVTLVREVALLDVGQASYSVVEGQPARVTVTRTGNQAGTVTVDYAASGGTAPAGDYTVLGSGTLTFTPNVQSRTFDVTTTNDGLLQGSRAVGLGLGNPVGMGALLGAQPAAVLTIQDNESPGVIGFGAAAYEVSEAAGPAGISVTRTGTNLAAGIIVQYQTMAGGTATANVDYTAVTGTLTFAAGQTALSFGVSVANDGPGDNGETVLLRLLNPSGGAALGLAQSTLTIRERYLALAQAAYSVGEGNASIVVTVNRLGDPAGTVAVRYATSNETATAGQDYPAVTGILTFGPGVTSRAVTIPIANDTLAEESETFLVTLSAPTGGAGVIMPAMARVTIVDNDLAGTVGFASSAFTAAETGNAMLALRRTGGSGGGVVVAFRTVDGTARAGVDYTARNGSVTFSTGQATQTIMVPVLPNQLVEGNRSFSVQLLAITPSGGALAPASTASVTIRDDDLGGVVKFAVPAASALEGSAALLALSRSGGTGGNVSVRWSTADGTATAAGADYPATSGTVTFGPGETTKSFSAPTLTDSAVEGDETFQVTLHTPVGLAIGTPSAATVTVQDAQQGLQFAAIDYSVSEAMAAATIAVARTGPATGVVTVRYSTSPGNATPVADYAPVNGVLTFANNARLASFTVPVVADTLAEEPETVVLTLSDPGAPAQLGARRTATLAILDNDTPGVFQMGAAAATVAESAGAVTLTVRRAGTAGGVTVDYVSTLGSGPQPSASAGEDYLRVQGTLTFGPGETTKMVTVPILNDSLDEPNEVFVVALATPGGGATLGAPVATVVTIVDDDVPGTIAFGPAAYTVAENAGVAVVTVGRAGGAAGAVTVDYATANGSATAGSDYTARTGRLTFNAGEMRKTLAVPILDDLVREGNETFTLTLDNPGGGAALGTLPVAVVTITDDETGPTVQFGAAAFSVVENAGTAPVTVTRTGSTLAGQSVLVRTIAGGTAPAGHFGTVNQTITFGAGQTMATVPVTIIDNASTIDGDRTVFLELANPSAPLSLGAPRLAVLTIRNDDAQLRFRGNAAVAEGGAATLTVDRVGSTLGPATVRYATANGTATAPGDYTARTGTLAFAAGVASQTVTFPTANDTIDEADETFTVTLSQPTGAVLGSPGQITATVTIQDNDAVGTVQFEAASFSVLEGGVATIAVTRTAGAAGPLTVAYATAAGGGATGGAAPGPGVDYLTRAGTLTFAAGASRLTFTVPTVQDALVEGPEGLALQLTVPPGSAAVLGAQGTASLTIVDDEQPRFEFTAATATVAEAAGSVTLTVRRLGPTGGNDSVNYLPAGLTATANADFGPIGGTLTFPPGVATRPLTVPIASDTLDEPAETFRVTLHTPSFGTGLGPISEATVTIVDDDTAGTVQFTAASYSVIEGGPVAVTVTRTGGTAGGASVAYASSDGDAVAGADYQGSSGILAFAAGEISKTLAFGTLLDTALEGAHFFEVTLGATTGGLTLGTPARTRVWIVDDEQVLRFSPEVYSVVEGGAATITLTRTGVPVGTVSAFIAFGGTAVAGTDYTPPGTINLVFPPGVTTRSFTIQTLPDTVVEPGGRTLTFNLSATVGVPSGPAAILTIVDNERPDLVVTSVAGPAQAANGLPMTVSAVVRNQSGAPATASKLGVFLSQGDSTPGAGIQLGVLNTPALMPLAQATVTGVVPVPAGVAAGSHFLSAVADTQGSVLEDTEGNNGLTAPTPVELVHFLPDLLVTGVPSPGGTLSGKLLSAPLHVRNAGPVASGPFRVGVFLSQNQSAGTGLLLATRDVPSLAPGSGVDLPVTLTVPDDVPQGQYFVVGQADLNGAVVESDETNNALASAVPFQVTRNLTKLTSVSASLSTAAVSPSCSSGLANLTLNLAGTLSLATQTGTTGQGTIVLSGPVSGGTVTFRGPFSATVNLDETVTISFTATVSGAFTGTATATGNGVIANGVVTADITSGLLTVTAPPLGSCPFTGTLTAAGQPVLFFSLLHFAQGGGFNGLTTPTPVYPLPITDFSLGLAAVFDPPVSPSTVTFSGPAGSGIAGVAAERRQPVTAGSFYETDTFSLAGRNLIGTWSVRYRGVDRTFTVANPQTEQRFVAMLPAVTLNAAQTHVVSISWVFKDRITGATVPAPADADAIQIEFTGFGIDYASPDFPRTVTSHTLPTPLPVANLEFLYISFKDTLTGHFYVTTYTQ